MVIYKLRVEGLILTGQGSSNDITIKNDADAVVAKVLTGTTNFELAANLVLASGQGIDFAATADSNAGLSSELFDDYEEGIYTPTIVCASSGSYVLNSGYDTLAYTKIGRVVHVQGILYVGSESSPSGQLRVSLPITPIDLADAADECYTACLLYNHGDGGVENVWISVVGATDYGALVNVVDTGATEAIDESRVDTNFGLALNFSYIA